MWNSDLTKVKRIIKLIINNVKDSSLDTGAEWEIDVDVVNKIYKIFPVKQINALINEYSDIFDLYGIKAGPDVSDGIFYNGKLISYQKEDGFGEMEVLFL